MTISSSGLIARQYSMEQQFTFPQFRSTEKSKQPTKTQTKTSNQTKPSGLFIFNSDLVGFPLFPPQVYNS